MEKNGLNKIEEMKDWKRHFNQNVIVSKCYFFEIFKDIQISNYDIKKNRVLHRKYIC